MSSVWMLKEGKPFDVTKFQTNHILHWRIGIRSDNKHVLVVKTNISTRVFVDDVDNKLSTVFGNPSDLTHIIIGPASLSSAIKVLNCIYLTIYI